MISTGKCPKCGSEIIYGPHRLHADDAHLKIDLPGWSTATLESFTCGACGYTEFYTDIGGLNNIRRKGRRYYYQPLSEEKDDKIISEKYTYCHICGKKIDKSSKFCRYCGSEVV